MRPEAVSAFLDLCDGIPEDDKLAWRRMAEDWESDNSKLNPYESSIKRKFPQCRAHNQLLTRRNVALTYNKARLDLAKEDEDRLKKDRAGTIVDKEISPLQLITQGLEIEEIQCISLIYHPLI